MVNMIGKTTVEMNFVPAHHARLQSEVKRGFLIGRETQVTSIALDPKNHQ